MTRFAYLVVMLGIAVTLILAFFDALPPSPWENTINDLIAFIHSSVVAQGMSWLAWFFPIGNVLTWIPATLNAMVAFYGARFALLVLKLHV